jgi:hypothetical protein
MILVLLSLTFLQQDTDSVRQFLKNNEYTVEWKTAAELDPNADLEISNGTGHGFNLRWLRFHPRNDRVEILSLALEEDRKPYNSKFPPDVMTLKIQKAEMPSADYAKLLSKIAIVDAAELTVKKRKKNDAGSSSSGDFWVHARLATAEKSLLEHEFAGYRSSESALPAAKPQAAVLLAQQAIKAIKFQEAVLTKEDRAWASAKFAREWKTFLNEEFHWWVRERSIMLIGVIGDESALRILREVLENAPKDRTVYHAINAITLLTNTDLRDKPPEDMDIAKTRERVIEFLKQRPNQ